MWKSETKSINKAGYKEGSHNLKCSPPLCQGSPVATCGTRLVQSVGPMQPWKWATVVIWSSRYTGGPQVTLKEYCKNCCGLPLVERQKHYIGVGQSCVKSQILLNCSQSSRGSKGWSVRSESVYLIKWCMPNTAPNNLYSPVWPAHTHTRLNLVPTIG